MRKVAIGLWIMACVFILNFVMSYFNLDEKFKIVFLMMNILLIVMAPVVAFLVLISFEEKGALRECEENLKFKEWKNRVIASNSVMYGSAFVLIAFWVFGIKWDLFSAHFDFFIIFSLLSLYVMFREVKILPLRKKRYDEMNLEENF